MSLKLFDITPQIDCWSGATIDVEKCEMKYFNNLTNDDLDNQIKGKLFCFFYLKCNLQLLSTLEYIKKAIDEGLRVLWIRIHNKMSHLIPLFLKVI